MLITASEVIKNTLPEKNMDVSLIELDIPVAERKYIRKVLGATLYNTIVSENDAQVFTGFNKTLLTEYIQPALANYVMYESMPIIAAEPTSQGFNKHAPVNTEAGTSQDFTIVRDKFISNAELYIDDMKEFACENSIILAGKNISGKNNLLIY